MGIPFLPVPYFLGNHYIFIPTYLILSDLVDNALEKPKASASTLRITLKQRKCLKVLGFNIM